MSVGLLVKVIYFLPLNNHTYSFVITVYAISKGIITKRKEQRCQKWFIGVYLIFNLNVALMFYNENVCSV